jgi:transketolase
MKPELARRTIRSSNSGSTTRSPHGDVLAVADRHAMAIETADPTWEGRDRFLLSHGHAAIAHYAALIEAGVNPGSELETCGSDDSRLPMSGMAAHTPGTEISGGSLGQGLIIGVGMAPGLKQTKNPALDILNQVLPERALA